MAVKKKPYQPKPLFRRILDEHKDWLFTMGYHERNLGLGEEPGRLVGRLREQFAKAVSLTLWEFRVEEFNIGVKGVFGAKKDPVDFTLHYAFDPHRTRLELTRLSATLYDQSVTYPIHNNTRRELPPADTVHQQLRAVVDLQLLEKLKETAKRPQRKQRR